MCTSILKYFPYAGSSCLQAVLQICPPGRVGICTPWSVVGDFSSEVGYFQSGVGCCGSGWVSSGVGYCRSGWVTSGWVTSVRGQGFSNTGGGLLQGGLLQGHFHHRLRWVTSGPRHKDLHAHAFLNVNISQGLCHHVR